MDIGFAVTRPEGFIIYNADRAWQPPSPFNVWNPTLTICPFLGGTPNGVIVHRTDEGRLLRQLH
ncbi:MAG TPA: hypothetical protein VF221_17775 [Chloroflexota bacterium]